MAWLPRTEVANILDHLQRALHLHQAVEWRAALGQRMPAKREQHLGGCGSVTHCALQYLSVHCVLGALQEQSQGARRPGRIVRVANRREQRKQMLSLFT